MWSIANLATHRFSHHQTRTPSECDFCFHDDLRPVSSSASGPGFASVPAQLPSLQRLTTSPCSWFAVGNATHRRGLFSCSPRLPWAKSRVVTPCLFTFSTHDNW